MIITPENTQGIRSFKLGYSRGSPTHQGPKLLTNTKTEEYFVTSLFAQMLIYNNIPVMGIEVCENDSDKGADTIIKVYSSPSKEIQITRFTLTDYIARRSIAAKQVDKLIEKVLSITNIPFQVNVKVELLKDEGIPLNKQKWEHRLAKEISVAIFNNTAELTSSNKFITHAVVDDKLKSYAPFIVLQSIPSDFNSNFYGKDNLFIDLDFDNVGFTRKHIEDECMNIYNKKNGGKAKILIIWADTFEILYNPQFIIEGLIGQFEKTTFEEVWFFDFYNHLDLHLQNKIRTAKIK